MSLARGLRCSTCARHVHPKIVRPSKISYTADFNQEVAVDCFELKDSEGKPWDFLSIVGIGNTFHIAGVLQSHKSEVLAATFLQLWGWAGPPGVGRVDMERGFGKEFLTVMGQLGTLVLPVARQAP